MDMAEKKYEQRWLIAVDNAMADRVDEWRGKQRPIPNRSEAVRQLIAKAIEAEDK
jgi:metal-responsive CopG/Arc/MetJ family transcriptional regulator